MTHFNSDEPNHTSVSGEVDEIISTIKSNRRMLLRDDTIGAVWDKDEDGKRVLKRFTADSDSYWAVTTKELAAIATSTQQAVIVELEAVFNARREPDELLGDTILDRITELKAQLKGEMK